MKSLETPSQEEFDDAARKVNETLEAHQLFAGYPKKVIHELVEQWYEQNDRDAYAVLPIIKYLEDGRYRKTAIAHLKNLSGVSHFRTSKPEPRPEIKSSNDYGMFIGFIIIFGYYYLIFFHTDLDVVLTILALMVGPAAIFGLIKLVIGKDLFD